MSDPAPPELLSLLETSNTAARDGAWAAFVDRWSALIIHAVQWGIPDRDQVMDRYAHVLEQLQANDFGRLRAFDPKGRARFSTWLVVVAKRLSLDWERHVTGRVRGNGTEATAQRESRRRLTSLVGEPTDVERLEQASIPDALGSLEDADRRTALDRALAALTPRDRLLLRLRFDDDMAVNRIAGLMGFPSQFHAYRALNRVLADLRARLVALGVDRSQ